MPVLVDLASAPGRTVVFTRTKHGAKALARQLNKSGVPAVDLHGNLTQNARTRNMEAFHSGKATTLVATDIAARGIHVDDVALVVHADPPVEHKAYLHRSGRTARAGAEGTVITLMTDEQVARRARPDPAGRHQADHHPVNGPGHPMLDQLAPGERVLVPGGYADASAGSSESRGSGSGRSGGTRRRRSGSGQGGSGQARSGQSKSGQARSGQAKSGQSNSGQSNSGQARSGRRGSQAAPARAHTAASFSSGRR